MNNTQQQTDLRRAHAASIAAQAKAKRESAAAAAAQKAARIEIAAAAQIELDGPHAAAKPAHTPGPWLTKAVYGDLRVVGGLTKAACNSRICDIQYWTDHSLGPSKAEAVANARLIAAAPELLKALIYLRDCAESGEWPAGKRWAQVQAAINNATGGAQ